jgi:hypothetical protein
MPGRRGRAAGGGRASLGWARRTVCRGEEGEWRWREREEGGGGGGGRENSPSGGGFSGDGGGGQPSGIVLDSACFSLAVSAIWGEVGRKKDSPYIHRGHWSRFMPSTGTVDPSIPIDGMNQDQ